MLRREVSSIMLPLSEYAVVDCDATLSDAIGALHQAQKGPAAVRHPHRAVLVRDSRGTIVGKLGHLGFLRALLPERRTWYHDKRLDQAGVSDDMKASSASIFELVGDEVVDVCERAKNVRVVDVCTPTTASIEHSASLLEATRAFLVHNTLSLLVTKEGRTVGIVRLADLFDEFARQVQYDDCG
jgi:hypothetical protein